MEFSACPCLDATSLGDAQRPGHVFRLALNEPFSRGLMTQAFNNLRLSAGLGSVVIGSGSSWFNVQSSGIKNFGNIKTVFWL